MMSQRQQEILAAMGVQAWVDRRALPVADAPGVAEEAQDEFVQAELAQADWGTLEQRVAACERCALHEGRTRTVFGVGQRDADWMIVGEAPGAEEDRQGEPFVGRSGQLLNEMLLAVGLRREQVYIANIVKCRPPGNRDPRPEEARECESYLQRQVALVSPRIILAVGRIAAQNLLKSERNIGELRGRVHHYDGIPVVVTYHPAYLLRTPREKRKAWDDLCLAARLAHSEHRRHG